ncbi:MAG: PEP-CTERM system histidine kinase PrsK [Verrucomicrobiales bacterium]|nr:PEP-CTERM system histidine kinase PrsK [Verrucomicrobiales bacterium]
MDPNVILPFIGAALAAILASGWLVAKHQTPAHWAFAAGLLVLAMDTALAGAVVLAPTEEAMFARQYGRAWCNALLPGIWLVFSLCYSRGNGAEFLRRWRWGILAVGLIPVALVTGFSPHLTSGAARAADGSVGALTLAWAGKTAQVAMLVGMLLAVVNLEKTFRSTVGLMRWRVKFVMIGLAVILGGRIYASSQAILFAAEQFPVFGVLGASLLVGTLLIAFSFARTGLEEIDVYPSHALLYGSLSVLLAGAYLLMVGLFAEAVSRLGGDQAFLAKSLFLLLALVGLVALLLSDRFRQQAQRFVSRHLRRPMYDYRRIWSAYTERTGSQRDRAGFCTAVAKLIAETFNVLAVTVWILDPARQRLQFGASTSLTGEAAGELMESDMLDLGEGSSALLSAVRAAPEPLDMDETGGPWVETLKRCNPDRFGKGGNRVCVPLVTGGEVLGLITLTDRVSGVRFSVEDYDLLKCIGDQVAAGLLNLQLSQKLLEAKEFEAFQSMSAFFVHDLKNTASTLSMMLENLPVHFDSAEFRADALRGIAKSVERINKLVERMTLLRRGFEVKPVITDLNEVVRGALRQLDGASGVRVDSRLHPLPPLGVDLEQFPKVLTNLLLNAREAVPAEGQIRVETTRRDGYAVVSVEDNGKGMSAEFLSRRLFRPFQTTKPKGLGIGLFQSRMIVEAHAGMIEVESELGKGTTFKVLLPLSPRDGVEGEPAGPVCAPNS